MSTPPVFVPITALDETGPAFLSAAANAKAFQSTIEASTGSFHEARAAVAVFNEEVGIKMSRHLQSAIASSELLQGILSKAFPVIAAVGFIEVLAHIPELMERAFNVVSGLDAENKMIEANARLEDSLHKIAEATALAAAAYERLGKSAEMVGVLDKRDAAETLNSAQARLSNLKTLLATQEEVAKQTERVGGGGSFRGGTPVSIQPTAEAKAAQEMIPALTEKIRELSERMTGLGIASASAGVKMDEAMTTAALKAEKFAEAGEKAKRAWGWWAERKRSGALGALETAPGQELLQNIPEIKPPDWLEKLSTSQSPIFSGSNSAMNLAKIQTDQNEAVKAAQAIYDSTRTKAQEYADTVEVLVELEFQGRISEQQFSAAVTQAAAKMDESSKAYRQLGNEIGRTITQSLLFGRSWSDALKAVLADILKLIVQMYVFKTISDSLGGKGGGFFGQLFAGMAGISGRASGGPVSSGMSYLVGEQGPELFTPGSSGGITPNSAMGGVTQYFDMRGSINTDDVVRRAELAGAMRVTESRSVARSVAATAQLSARR